MGGVGVGGGGWRGRGQKHRPGRNERNNKLSRSAKKMKGCREWEIIVSRLIMMIFVEFGYVRQADGP